MNITRKSMLTGKTRTRSLPVTQEQIERWESGQVLIQNCFPDLSADDREFILTGVDENEWEEVFGNDE